MKVTPNPTVTVAVKWKPIPKFLSEHDIQISNQSKHEIIKNTLDLVGFFLLCGYLRHLAVTK